MHPFLKQVQTAAQSAPKTIVFPEGGEARVKEAIIQINKDKTAIPLPILNSEIFFNEAKKSEEKKNRYIQALAERRNISPEEANKKLKDPHTLGAMIVHLNEADAMISGPTAPSKERILPALKIIKSKEGHRASAYFIMILPDHVNKDAANGGVLFFADCALNIDPTEDELVQIAIDTADSAKALGFDPKIALLTFSTEGSSQDPHAQKMAKVSEKIKTLRPDLHVSKDMQVDAALMDQIGARKAPGSDIAGHANVLIFPNLEAGNIAYKLVERLAGATAIGPILQGLNKTVNELSRGCSSQDIVHLAALTSVIAQNSNS
jgi:phosphate acetyltransferase